MEPSRLLNSRVDKLITIRKVKLWSALKSLVLQSHQANTTQACPIEKKDAFI